jgi:hypothetical protein
MMPTCLASGKSQLLLVFRQVTTIELRTNQAKLFSLIYSNKSLIHTKQNNKVGTREPSPPIFAEKINIIIITYLL